MWQEVCQIRDRAELKRIQNESAQKVITYDSFPQTIQVVGGMDLSNNMFDPAQMVYAAVVTLSYPELCVVETGTCAMKQPFPYMAGFLSFREAPPLITAFQKLASKPDILLIDGHGISHPRGLGVASHIGVLLDLPTIGIAKTILVGRPEGTLGEDEGSSIPLVWKGKKIGLIIRLKKRCAPIIVSTGHRVSLESAVEIVKHCYRDYRLPEPTRQAHLAANALRRQAKSLL